MPPAQNVVVDAAAIVAVGKLLTVTVVVVVFVQAPTVTVYVMVAVPAETPVTSPVEAFTDATDELLDDHEPPLTELDKVVLELIQTLVVPEIVPALGSALMVSTATSLFVPHALVA